LNSLTSFPPQINGRTTACVGDEISLTCSRNNSGAAITDWIFSSPVNCSRSDVSHNTQAASPPQCGPFTFMNITRLAEENVAQLNSTVTAVANANSEINGSIIECMFGIRMPISVGNTSLCVISKYVMYYYAYLS
jgi:stage III sporulation protein SpoIIIAA